MSPKIDHMFNLYFAGPSVSPRHKSVLHLARRDICQCFGYDPNSYEVGKEAKPSEDGRQALWPGAMTIFAAIDLLAKFFAGTDEKVAPKRTKKDEAWRFSAGGRLKEFLRTYFTVEGVSVNADQTEALYRLRCALDHSFALWAQRKNEVHIFTLDRDGGGQLLTQRPAAGPERIVESVVYLYDLHKAFEQALAAFQVQYRTELETDEKQQERFTDLVDRYGFIGIAKASTFGWG